ncbi:MAG: glycosyltransferase family 9 protein [Ignavibacteriaceae bacterium]
MEVLSSMAKILIIQTAFIGDAILTLPMIQKLKEFFPESEIDVIAIPSTAEIFSASSFVNEVIVLDKKNRHKSFFALIRFSKELRKKNYSKVYSPHRSFRSSFIVMNLNVNESYGFSTGAIKHVYKNLIEYKTAHHEVQRNLDLIGYNYAENEWRIQPVEKIPEIVTQKIENYFANLKVKSEFIAIAPGSVWNTKKYPAEYFEEIIKYLNGKIFKIILIGSEKEKKLCDEIALKSGEDVFSTAGKFSLIESIELLRRTKILISNDSAPTHLGMCAGIPVLTLFCSTIPGFGFYPYSEKSSYLSYDDLSCKPCGIHGKQQCPVKTFDCGFKLSPKIVITKVEEMLND